MGFIVVCVVCILVVMFVVFYVVQVQSDVFVIMLENVFDGDYLMVGVGGVYGLSYEGFDDYVFLLFLFVQGLLCGVGINLCLGGIVLDLVFDGQDVRVGL